MKNLKQIIDFHYQVTEIEDKVMDLDYPLRRNPKLDDELCLIHNAIQNIKELIEEGKVDLSRNNSE